jgi:hypothetical protein
MLGVAGFAYAQTQDPPNQPAGGYGPGMMGGGSGQGGPGMMGGGYGPGMMGGSGQQNGPAVGSDEARQAGYGPAAVIDGPMHEYFEAAFAEALGLTVEEVQQRTASGETYFDIALAQGTAAEDFPALITQVRTTAVNQMVADGVLTQEKADLILERMDNYVPGSDYGPGMMAGFGPGEMMGNSYGRRGYAGMMGGFGPAGMMGGQAGWMYDYILPALANAFGLTVEDLQARFDAGQTPWDIAQERGLTEEEFSGLMTQAHAAALGQAVADGVISQEQADAMLAHMTQMWQGGVADCPMHDIPNQP